ncbi:hypothetical protein CDAR_586341 [Caerostris darwini]|uniref:Uncharacterized protein n=1 Tax=Caerostris darwini TaxID=1538125 RepID=A0AAV4Q816_9ARAC|nr:hypothetical protein CDAR_586341 [Caerostris darwini]
MKLSPKYFGPYNVNTKPKESYEVGKRGQREGPIITSTTTEHEEKTNYTPRNSSILSGILFTGEPTTRKCSEESISLRVASTSTHLHPLLMKLKIPKSDLRMIISVIP